MDSVRGTKSAVDPSIHLKCALKSSENRKKANDLFAKRMYAEAVNLYSQAIIDAPLNSEELYTAFGNRSAALFHLNEYKLCLKDIGYAIKFGYPTEAIQKLKQRQQLCERKLKETETVVSVKNDQNSNTRSQTYEYFSPNMESFESEYCGKGLKATRKIRKGDTILVEKPYVACLLKSQYKGFCYHCFKRVLPKFWFPCRRCTQILFCSLECSEKSWNEYHSLECLYLDMFHINDDFQFPPKLVLRIFIKSGLDILFNDKTISKDYETFNDFVHHKDWNNYSPIAAFMLDFLLFHNKSVSLSEEEKSKAMDTIDKHMRQIQVNAITLFTRLSSKTNLEDDLLLMTEQTIGCGVYLKSRLLNHSCKPNCEIAFCDGNIIKINACEDIEQGDELLISYGSHYKLHTFTKRQEMIRDSYFFDCKCEACTQRLQPLRLAVRCPVCKGPVVNDNQNSICLECELTNHLDIENLANASAECLNRINVCCRILLSDNCNFDVVLKGLLESYDTFSKILYSEHNEIVTVLQKIRTAYQRREDYENEYKFSRKYFKIAKKSIDGVAVFNALLRLIKSEASFCRHSKNGETEKVRAKLTKHVNRAMGYLNDLMPKSSEDYQTFKQWLQNFKQNPGIL